MAQPHMVKCYYCGKTFNADKEEYAKPVSNRYAHKMCYEQHQTQKTKEEKDKEELESYILNLFSISCISPKIKKQIKTFHDENKYSYSAIRKTLIYFFDVRGNPLEKANEGIGIVPWAIADASKYWKSIEQAQQKNKDKEDDIQIYKEPPKEIRINIPKRNPMRHYRNFFSFLDEEVKI